MDMSIADVMSLGKSGDGDKGWLFWIVVLFLISGNGFGFGGNRVSDQITNEFLFNTLNNGMNVGFSDVKNSLTSIANGLCSSTYELSGAIKDCCCTTNRNIDAVRYENAQNTCTITGAIKDGVQTVLNQLCADRTQALRDELNKAYTTISNQAQTQNLLSVLHPSPIPAYTVANPYCPSTSTPTSTTA